MSTMNTVGRPTAPNAVTTKPATLTGGRGLLQNEALIFEGDGWGKTGVDLAEPKTDGSDLGDLVRKDPMKKWRGCRVSAICILWRPKRPFRARSN